MSPPGGAPFAALGAGIARRPARYLPARVLVVTSVAAYAALLAGAAVLHYLVFRTPHSDLGNMAQAVWSTAHGHFLGMTAASGHDITRLGVHIEPFLVLLVPL